VVKFRVNDRGSIGTGREILASLVSLFVVWRYWLAKIKEWEKAEI